jgi:branched-chain amino acid transport system permease protein
LNQKIVRNCLTAFLLVVVAAGPLFTSEPYHVFVMNTICINAILVLALNFILGLAGQVFMGTIAFFAIASYTTGMLFKYFEMGFWSSLPFSIGLTALVSFFLGIPTLRVSGAYLALMSMGFIIVVGDVIKNWMSFTGGVWGIMDIPRPNLFGFLLDDNLYMFYLAFGFLLLLTVAAILIEDSRYGLSFKAVRDDQLAIEMCGLDSTRVKVLAFVLCGVYTGVAGSLFASFNLYISPEIFTFNYNSIFMCMLVVGGLASIPGSVLGGILLTVAIEILRPLREKYLTVFALIIIIILLFEPGGLTVLFGKTLERLKAAFGGRKAGPKEGERG